MTLPITAVVSDVPAGEISLQCKNATSQPSPAVGGGSVRAARHQDGNAVTTEQCKAGGGRVVPDELEAPDSLQNVHRYTGCRGGKLHNRAVEDPPKSTGTVQATKAKPPCNPDFTLGGCY